MEHKYEKTITDYQYNTVDAFAPVWRIRLLMLMNKPEDKSSPGISAAAILLGDTNLVTDYLTFKGKDPFRHLFRMVNQKLAVIHSLENFNLRLRIEFF